MESLSNVNGLVVHAVLRGTALEVGLLLLGALAVGLGDAGGVEPQGAPSFEVDEAVGGVGVVELKFEGAMEGVEEDDFVAVVSHVA